VFSFVERHLVNLKFYWNTLHQVASEKSVAVQKGQNIIVQTQSFQFPDSSIKCSKTVNIESCKSLKFFFMIVSILKLIVKVK
jgi:hypothetical protein